VPQTARPQTLSFSMKPTNLIAICSNLLAQNERWTDQRSPKLRRNFCGDSSVHQRVEAYLPELCRSLFRLHHHPQFSRQCRSPHKQSPGMVLVRVVTGVISIERELRSDMTMRLMWLEFTVSAERGVHWPLDCSPA
jgi:hypothetical protein